jgi:hypothetical protein
MQVLQSTDVVPNLTLRRLIRNWSDSQLLRPSNDLSLILKPAISRQQILDAFKCVRDANNTFYSNSLSRMIDFANYSDENREFLSRIDEFVPEMVSIMVKIERIEVIELVVAVLHSIKSESGIKEQLNKLIISNKNLSPFLSVLQKGNLNSRIMSARILESIAFDSESQLQIATKKGLLYEFYRLVNSETDSTAIDSGLSAIIALSTSRAVKKDLIRFGIVQTATKILSEKSLKLLEQISTCTEGRTSICNDESCVTEITKSLMKLSSAATEHGITVVWSVCYLARDQTAQNAVMKSNGLTKLLLVMQSNCTALVRQMCGDLVKVFRVNSKSCLASYETRTTHITPY